MNSVVYEIVFEEGASEADRAKLIGTMMGLCGVRRMVPVYVMTSEQTRSILERAFQDNVAATVGQKR